MFSYIQSMFAIGKRRNIEDAAMIEFFVDGVYEDFTVKIPFYNSKNITELQTMLIQYKNRKKNSCSHQHHKNENGRDKKPK